MSGTGTRASGRRVNWVGIWEEGELTQLDFGINSLAKFRRWLLSAFQSGLVDPPILSQLFSHINQSLFENIFQVIALIQNI